MPKWGRMSWLKNLKEGDVVKRLLGAPDGVPMFLKVSSIDEKFIHCGPWKFSRSNGAEVDEELGWDEKRTGSYLEEP